MIKDLISDFLAEHPMCHSADDIVGHCYSMSKSFVYNCKHRGIDAKLFLLMDYVGEPFKAIHPEWKDEDFLVHCVVVIGEDSYDFTRRQFDVNAPVPFKQTLEELRKEWETISEEEFLPLEVSDERSHCKSR